MSLIPATALNLGRALPHKGADLSFPGAARLAGLLPGVALCVAVTAAAVGLQHVEARLFGRAWLEALVLAILLGAAVRTAWRPGARWIPGINFSAKFVLEVAVMLLGASISASAILAAGPMLLAGIAGLVVLAISVSYGLGRLFGLPHKMATLIACGNSICGNSAIAAVAPVIGAHPDDVAASIAFTAVLGVGVVLGLPLLIAPLHFSASNFGVFAGLTVYAVPQVLAATAPAGTLAVQMGTLDKLVRVLMLGPVCLALALIGGAAEGGVDMSEAGPVANVRAKRALPPVHHLVPWFIVGFLVLAAARSAGITPQSWVAPSAGAATWLTIVSMAALGLGVDLRVIGAAGPRVTAVVTLSLTVLGVIAFSLIHLLGLH
jgi:uncharacterized integral membrane protein (TIGR00698 family)